MVLIGAALGFGAGHTPYKQWQVYRLKHLLIGTSRADGRSYPLGQQIVQVLLRHLPESRARVTRGPDAQRLASLLTTGQLDVVLLARADAAALQDGRPPFQDFGPTGLRALHRFGDHLLVTRPDFPEHHAWQIARTLREYGHEIAARGPRAAEDGPVPAHPGALAYARGEPMPPALEPAGLDLPHDHVH